MTKISLYSSKSGNKLKQQINLPDNIFKSKINNQLMAQAVRVYLANQRQASARTKSRGQVVTSTKKIWQQKGTGRARHGSRNAPIFVGGAKAHGPTGQQNYRLTMMKKQKKQSLLSSLSQQLKNNNIIIVKDLAKIKLKTKNFDQLFYKLFDQPRKIFLISDKKHQSINKGVNNLSYLTHLSIDNLHPYHILNAHKLVFTNQAINQLIERYDQ